MSVALRSFDKIRWATLGLWLALFGGVMVAVFLNLKTHTTMPTYQLASARWWQGIDPYTMDAHAGFLYFPQAAVLFTPFHFMPVWGAEIFWRATTFGLYFYALVRLGRFFLSEDGVFSAKTFLYLSLLAVWSSLASLRNAQFDLPLAALVVLTSAEVAASRWTAAAIWICLAVALKPLAVVPLLLFTALYWKLIPRVIIGMAVVIALPFLHWSPSFVAHEYVRCFQTLVMASKGDEPRYSDLAALLSLYGYAPSPELKTVVRVIFAAVYLGIGWLAVRRLKGIESAWVVGALSADYLMLFNPRTETCSFVFLGSFVASLALFYAQQSGRRAAAWMLGVGAICLACDAFPTIHHVSLHLLTDRWMKPLVAVVFFFMMLQFIFEKRPAPAQRSVA